RRRTSNGLIAAGNYRRTNDGRYTGLHVTSVGDIRQRENQEHDRRDGKEHYATHFTVIVGNGERNWPSQPNCLILYLHHDRPVSSFLQPWPRGYGLFNGAV